VICEQDTEPSGSVRAGISQPAELQQASQDGPRSMELSLVELEFHYYGDNFFILMFKVLRHEEFKL
jgi:hypothetical protein